MPHITTVVDLGQSFNRFKDKWPERISGILSDLSYRSYRYQREYGLSHKDCMSIGLGEESYEKRYNTENSQIKQKTS